MGMNQAPITLILIAAVGLVAVITLGIFFAVRPRATVDKTTRYYSDFREGPEYEQKKKTDLYTTLPPARPEIGKSLDGLNNKVKNDEVGGPVWWTPKPPAAIPPTALPPASRPPSPPHHHEAGLENLILPPSSSDSKPETEEDKVVIDTVSKDLPSFPPSPSFPPPQPKPQPQPHPPSPSPSRPPLRRPIIPIERRVESEVAVGKPRKLNKPFVQLETTESSYNLDAVKMEYQAQFSNYGRVVGLAYHNKHLYVPSHRDGNISILSTPDLKLIQEITCENCRVYDMVVLDNGDIIIAQGKRRALAKVSDGNIIERQDMEYASKGIALSPGGDQVYVLTRGHDRIYKYDINLKPNGSLALHNPANDDCNFITVNKQGHIYVSCENQVFVIDDQGTLLNTLVPQRGSYSVGIDVDPNNRVFVVRRGKAHVDVYDDDKLVQSLGDDSDVLWSDLAVGDEHFYVIDYIAVTVQAYKYTS